MSEGKLKVYRFAATRVVSLSVEVEAADDFAARQLAQAQAFGPERAQDWRDALDASDGELEIEDVEDAT